MAVAFKHFCTIKSRIKGDHVYKADPRINSTCGCFPEPGNTHSAHAVIVKIKESSTHHAAEQTAGHVPDSLAEILYQPLVDGNITINSKITGQSRSAPEGTWVQGGGLEIPCLYEVFLRSSLPDLKASLKEKLSSSVMRMEQPECRINQSTESFVILF